MQYDYDNISSEGLVNVLRDYSPIRAIESLSRKELIDESERLLYNGDLDEILLILEEGN